HTSPLGIGNQQGTADYSMRFFWLSDSKGCLRSRWTHACNSMHQWHTSTLGTDYWQRAAARGDVQRAGELPGLLARLTIAGLRSLGWHDPRLERRARFFRSESATRRRIGLERNHIATGTMVARPGRRQ